MPVPWRLHLFGGLVLMRPGDTDGSSRVRLPATQTGALLARLALPDVGRQYRREALADLLWPDEPELTARHRLRQTLVELRRLLGDTEALRAERNSISLEPEALETDVAGFQSAVQAAERAARSRGESSAARLSCLTHATDLYTSELLPTFPFPWISDERDRLRLTFLDCLKSLALCAEAQNDRQRAIGAARRLVSAEPHDEESILLLLRLLVTAGQGDAARREYERFRKATQRADVKLPLLFRRQVRELLGTAAATVVAVPAPTTAPPPASEPIVGTMLVPAFLTRFFGREKEIEQITSLISDPSVHLVTLTGPGGLGKTRLTVEAVTRLNRSACFVALAALPASAGAAEMAAQIAGALGLPPATASDEETGGLAAVVSALQMRPPLILILDNLEHLLASGVPQTLSQALLNGVPSLTICATSRLPLAVAGEIIFPVPPLPVTASVPVTSDDSRAAGVALFLDRARALRPDFAITANNAATITELCRRLDGLPLALEIAAGWARTVTPEEMLNRLERRFAFLVRRSAAENDRHRSLETTITGSYEMLAPNTARFFRHLCVFQGGFSAAAAEAVAGVDDADALAALDTLCEHNLIVAGPASDCLPEMRFTMLETLREFAAEQLTSDERTEAEWRHVAYFHDLAWAGDEGLKGPEQGVWWERLAIEKPNLRLAFFRPDRTPEDGILRARLLVGLLVFWNHEDVWEAMPWIKAALAIPYLPPDVRGRLLVCSGAWENAFGDRTLGQAMIAEGVQLIRTTGNRKILAEALVRWPDNPDALAEAVTLCSQFGWKRTLAHARGYQAVRAAYKESREEAISGFATARKLVQECQDWLGVQGALFEEAYHRARWGEIAIAAEMWEDQFRLATIHKFRGSGPLDRLGRLRQRQGNWEEARKLLIRAENWSREFGWGAFLVEILLYRARLHTDLYETDAAYACLEERDQLRAAISPGIPDGLGHYVRAQLALSEGDFLRAARLADAALRAFGEDAYGGWRAVARIARGQAALLGGHTVLAMATLHEALVDAIGSHNRMIAADAIEAYGQGAATAGRFTDAAFVLGFATAERSEMGIVLPPIHQPNHDAAVALVRSSLASQTFASYWARGTRTTITVLLRHITSKPLRRGTRRSLSNRIAR